MPAPALGSGHAPEDDSIAEKGGCDGGNSMGGYVGGSKRDGWWEWSEVKTACFGTRKVKKPPSNVFDSFPWSMDYRNLRSE